MAGEGKIPNTNIIISNHENSLEVAKSAAQAINAILSEFGNKCPVLLMLAGGSSLQVLDHIDKSQLGNWLTVCVSDERFDESPQVNNFLQLSATNFFQEIINHQVQFIDTRRTQRDQSPHDLAERWQKSLHGWYLANKNGKIISLLGIGEDGHVCGIMPMAYDQDKFSKLFESQNETNIISQLIYSLPFNKRLSLLNQAEWLTAYDAGAITLYNQRVTPNNYFLRKLMDHTVVFVTGENKNEAVKKVLDKDGELFKTPARILREMKKVQLFTDIQLHSNI